MKILSRNDIEGIAGRVVAQYRKLPEVDDSQLSRIDPVLLAKRVFGLSVEYEHLSVSGRLLGVTSGREAAVEICDDKSVCGYYVLDGKTILVEKALTQDERMAGRHNFTVAHEAAHQIFMLLYPKEYGALTKRAPLLYCVAEPTVKKRITDWEEWQANALASAVLLPADLVMHCMFLFGLPEKLRWINRIYGQQEYEKFSNIASFLGVSKKALAIRMKQIGVLGRDYLDDPYALVAVEGEVGNNG